MRTHVTFVAAAVALALGIVCDANAQDKASGVDAKLRSTTEASVREQTALELRSARLRGLARSDFDARVGAEGELDGGVHAQLKNETEAEIEAQTEAEVEAGIDVGVDAEIAAAADEVEAAVDAVIEQSVEAEVRGCSRGGGRALSTRRWIRVDAAVESEIESTVAASWAAHDALGPAADRRPGLFLILKR
jgi:hypothetical protein